MSDKYNLSGIPMADGMSYNADNASLITEYLREKGWPNYKIAGLLANLAYESQMDPMATRKSGVRTGLAQWKTKLVPKGTSLKKQVDFLDQEDKVEGWHSKNKTNGWNPKVKQKINYAERPEVDYARRFSDGYERHGSPSSTNLRRNMALEFKKKLDKYDYEHPIYNNVPLMRTQPLPFSKLANYVEKSL